MPFIPHTPDQIQHMLQTLQVDNIQALFDEIPASILTPSLAGLPERLTEMEVGQLMRRRATQDGQPQCFIGAGAYEHHIPAAVWEVTTRGEFYSAYTPYQAEASQGTLQLLYEYQSMMAALMGMDVSNASLYDGATALAEAVLMAVRLNRKAATRTILIPQTVHPFYRAVVHSIVKNQNIRIEEIPFDPKTGITDLNHLPASGHYAALVIPQPNFFGALEEVHELTRWAKKHQAIAIAVVNPLSLGILTPPGQWGDDGVDIACGEGQPLGIPLASGGPYFGILCCKQAGIRQLPGRLIGCTTDREGKTGFTLTLQAREQHIRRSKATSNICTNQGLLVTAATIYMSIMGPDGLRQTAAQSHANTVHLRELLGKIPGVKMSFSSAIFHEFVIQLPKPAQSVCVDFAKQNVLAGFSLAEHYPALENALLVCVTETKTKADLHHYAALLQQVLCA